MALLKKKLCLQYLRELGQCLKQEQEQDALKILESAVQAWPDDETAQPTFGRSPSGTHGLDLRQHPQALFLYTDGACRNNPGPGAWAVLLQDAQNNVLAEASGSEFLTTNNRMELQAVIEGLKAAGQYFKEKMIQNPELFLYSDSQLVVNGIESWLAKWKQKNWIKSNGQPVENQEYWQEVDALAENMKIYPTWVRGHNGHPQNEYCDHLANQALDELLLKKKN